MEKLNLTESLKKLEEINAWFENQEEVDVEKGLDKVKEGVKLVKASRERLQEIENEFIEIKKDIAKETAQNSSSISSDSLEEQEKPIGLDEIPF